MVLLFAKRKRKAESSNNHAVENTILLILSCEPLKEKRDYCLNDIMASGYIGVVLMILTLAIGCNVSHPVSHSSGDIPDFARVRFWYALIIVS